MTYTTFDTVFERFRYPAGERHLRLRDLCAARSVTVIEARAAGFEALAQIVVADRVLRRNEIHVTWFVPYFPFARHDRRIDIADGFELALALELVSELDIVIADPHSDVAGQLPHIPQTSVVDVLRARGVFDDDPIIVIPDAGAAKKVGEWTIGTTSTVVQALKHRDPMTGDLSDFALLAGDLGGRPAILVDDICDGGGTFLGLATELRAHNTGPLTLAVTHGLFTQGTESLREYFDHIVCFAPTGEADTHDGVERIPFQTLLEKGARR